MGMFNAVGVATQPALVVKEMSINETGPHYVHIVARPAGLIPLILSFVGIDAKTFFDVYEDRIECSQGSLSGQLNTCMPLSAVSVTTGGYVKPFIFLVFAIALIPVFFLIPVSVILILLYYFSKRLVVSVVSNAGEPITLCFKRSFVEGVEVNVEEALKITGIIKKLTLAQTAKA